MKRYLFLITQPEKEMKAPTHKKGTIYTLGDGSIRPIRRNYLDHHQGQLSHNPELEDPYRHVLCRRETINKVIINMLFFTISNRFPLVLSLVTISQ
jgi:hypothetical protein